MSDVSANFKPAGPCRCGRPECQLWGTYKGAKHAEGCTCVPCQKGHHSRQGNKEQRRVALQLSKAGLGTGAGGEQRWRFKWRTEVKADKQAQQVATFFDRTRQQSNKDKAFGDPRPFVPIAVAEDGRQFAVVLLAGGFAEVIEDGLGES